ncbi:GH32 C-terminal domain-containing protein [Kribbella sp. NPDC050124]|uniref:GH32 C-terminal domain-containing protein n=1 Tax=Kribbella sp. NPDC050124 TaxID=3364114 RepID=UPI0037A29860
MDDPRPRIHFAPERNWINDPNGLVWHDGEYHLFYQYNPAGTDHANLAWGHAVSPDLLTWEELPVAIPATDREQVFSGSVVIDHENTAGFGAGTMVAIYTGFDPETGQQSQCVAWSADRGRTFTRSESNPVLDIGSTEFRDPKVLWYGDAGYWVMAVARPEDRMIQFYRSHNLTAWTHLSDFGAAGSTEGIWECPDLFPLAVDGEPGATAWVLLVSVVPGGPAGGSATQYFLGRFDGVHFAVDDPEVTRWLDYGADCYAAVSFSNLPSEERIVIGWMSNWDYAAQTPTSTYRGQMTIPRRLTLEHKQGELVLRQTPVAGDVKQADSQRLQVAAAECLGSYDMPCLVSARVKRQNAGEAGFQIEFGRGDTFTATVSAAGVHADRTGLADTGFSPTFAARHTAPSADCETISVLIDHTAVEIFADEGRVVLSEVVFPSGTDLQLSAISIAGDTVFEDLSVRPV